MWLHKEGKNTHTSLKECSSIKYILNLLLKVFYTILRKTIGCCIKIFAFNYKLNSKTLNMLWLISYLKNIVRFYKIKIRGLSVFPEKLQELYM